MKKKHECKKSSELHSFSKFFLPSLLRSGGSGSSNIHIAYYSICDKFRKRRRK